MHILFLLLPIFYFQIHVIRVRGGIQGKELFGDTGKQERWLSTLWYRVAGAPFKFSPRLDFEMAIPDDALPDYDLLDQLEELCVWEIGE